MILYETVNKLCSYGKHVVLHHPKQKLYKQIWGYGECYLVSDDYSFGNLMRFTRKDHIRTKVEILEEKGWRFHSVYEPPVKQYEVGDKVISKDRYWFEVTNVDKVHEILDLAPLNKLGNQIGYPSTQAGFSAVTPYIPEIHDEENAPLELETIVVDELDSWYLIANTPANQELLSKLRTKEGNVLFKPRKDD